MMVTFSIYVTPMKTNPFVNFQHVQSQLLSMKKSLRVPFYCRYMENFKFNFSEFRNRRTDAIVSVEQNFKK